MCGVGAVGAVACGLPHDASGTLARVRGGAMRVGVVIDTPWTTSSADGGAGGVEGELARSLARQLDARIAWVHGQPEQLLELLRHRELDLVIGGFTASSPWKKQVGVTRPFFVDTELVAGAVGQPPPGDINQLTIAVREGDPVAAAIRKHGGTPVPMHDLSTTTMAIAAPSWRLAQLNRAANARIRLSRDQHVLFASPGENAWLWRVERFLFAERGRVPGMLRASPR